MTSWQWRGITLGVGSYQVTDVEGWLGLPGGSFETVRTSGHGSQRTPVVQGPRTILMRGFIRGTATQRDTLLGQLAAAMEPNDPFDFSTEPLVGDRYGRWMTANAQLVDFDPEIKTGAWQGGIPAWQAEWHCPDPRFYGDWITTASALVVPTAGLAKPFFKPAFKPAKPVGGRVQILNTGSDKEGSPMLVTLTGAQSGTVGLRVGKPSGEVVTATWNLTLGTADTLVVDTEAGGAYLNATADLVSGSAVGGVFRAPATLIPVSNLRPAPGANYIQALGLAGAGSPAISVSVHQRSW